MRDSGEFEAMPKKEALILGRELEKLERNLSRHPRHVAPARRGVRARHQEGAPRRRRGQQAGHPGRRRRRHQLRPRPGPVRHPRQRRRHPGQPPDVPGHLRRRRSRAATSPASATPRRRRRRPPRCARPRRRRRSAPTRPQARRQAAAAQAERDARLSAQRAASPTEEPAAEAGRRGAAPPTSRRPRSRRRAGRRGAADRRGRAAEPSAEVAPPRPSRRRGRSPSADRRGRSRGRRRRDEAGRRRGGSGRRRHGVRRDHHRDGVLIPMSFTAKDVQALRQATGAGMMDAKRALEAADGDFEVAAQWLREKGLAKAAERVRAGEHPGRGRRSFVDGGVGSIVQLKCETDFVASSERFKTLVSDMAALVTAKGIEATADRAKELEELQLTLKEHIELGEVVRIEAADGNVLDSLPARPGRPRRQRRARRARRRHGAAGPRHRRAHRLRPPEVPRREDVPAERGREGAGHAGGHHPQRGQAGAGHRQDRRGPPQRLLQGDLPAGAALRQGRQAVDRPAPRRRHRWSASPRSRSAETRWARSRRTAPETPRRGGGGWC